jgi:hypothetical protein
MPFTASSPPGRCPDRRHVRFRGGAAFLQTRADIEGFILKEHAMTNSILKHAIGLAAAATTTLVLFSSVVRIAEDDKRSLAAARVVPTQLAAASDPQQP